MGKYAEAFRKKLVAMLSPYGSVAEFCRQTGFSRPGVEKWLQGASTPSITNLETIGMARDIPPWQLIQPDGDKTFAERLIPFEILQKYLKLSPEKQKQVLKQFEGLLELADADGNDGPKKKASNS